MRSLPQLNSCLPKFWMIWRRYLPGCCNVAWIQTSCSCTTQYAPVYFWNHCRRKLTWHAYKVLCFMYQLVGILVFLCFSLRDHLKSGSRDSANMMLPSLSPAQVIHCFLFVSKIWSLNQAFSFIYLCDIALNTWLRRFILLKESLLWLECCWIFRSRSQRQEILLPAGKQPREWRMLSSSFNLSILIHV